MSPSEETKNDTTGNKCCLCFLEIRKFFRGKQLRWQSKKIKPPKMGGINLRGQTTKVSREMKTDAFFIFRFWNKEWILLKKK